MLDCSDLRPWVLREHHGSPVSENVRHAGSWDVSPQSHQTGNTIPDLSPLTTSDIKDKAEGGGGLQRVWPLIGVGGQARTCMVPVSLQDW